MKKEYHSRKPRKQLENLYKITIYEDTYDGYKFFKVFYGLTKKQAERKIKIWRGSRHKLVLKLDRRGMKLRIKTANESYEYDEMTGGNL